MTTKTETQGRWTREVIGGTIRRTWRNLTDDTGVIAYTTWTTPRTGEGDPGERFHEYTVVVDERQHLLYREDMGDTVTDEDGELVDDALARVVLGFVFPEAA